MRIRLDFLFFRYLFALLLGLNSLYLFYIIFTPLTIYLSYFLFKLFYDSTTLSGNSIFLKQIVLEIIPSCVSGAAYYFLVVLNLSTPMNIRKRISSILFLLISFLILNVLRIVFLGFLALQGIQYFNATPVFINNTSHGVKPPNLLRGLLLIKPSTRLISSSEIFAKSVPFGKYLRIRPFRFSFEPLSCGQ